MRTCCVVWLVPENIETVVTLFRDPRRCEFEDKDWSFSIEVMVNAVFTMLSLMIISTSTVDFLFLYFLTSTSAGGRLFFSF